MIVTSPGLQADPAAFFRAHYPPLYAWVARVSGAPTADVEDLVQETLLHAWKNREQFRGSASPLAWISAIARHKIRDRWRARPAVPADVLSRLDEVVLPDDVVEAADVRRRVRACLDGLPSEQADLLRARYLEGLSVLQISQRLGEGEKAVESRLHRAREAFRKRLAQGENDDA
ncbi:MAG TPA: RNA polymerase sigma factor [Planctomycetota bacterium]|nr:RNA polymerase sigma factor [Planctomycetota bacterium]